MYKSHLKKCAVQSTVCNGGVASIVDSQVGVASVPINLSQVGREESVSVTTTEGGVACVPVRKANSTNKIHF